MAIRCLKQYAIHCDVCNEMGVSSHGDNGCWVRRDIENWLREKGWTVGKKILCPSCKKTEVRGE